MVESSLDRGRRTPCVVQKLINGDKATRQEYPIDIPVRFVLREIQDFCKIHAKLRL